MTVQSWLLNNLRPASFRGIPFEVETAEKTGGPRTITHEFPLRKDPTHEFVGNLPNSFSLEAVLIADDLLDQVDRLEKALYDTSPGRLIHPWYGEMDVVVIGEVRTRKSSKEGRVARISIQFQLFGGEASPTAVVDTAAAVNRAADAAQAAIIADFVDTFIGRGVQDFVTSHALQVVAAVADTAIGTMRSFGLTAELASGYIGATSGSLAELHPAVLQEPAALADQVSGLFKPTITRPKPNLSLSSALLALGNGAGVGGIEIETRNTTPSWKRAVINQQAVIALAQVSAAIQGTRAGTQAGWDSRDQAIAWRDLAGDDLDQAADIAGAANWDATWQTATDLRAALIKDVATRAAPLPRLAILRPAATLPTALLAYQIDGDDLRGLFDRAEDLRRRNSIRHPGFVPGATPLEVLVDA